MESSSSPPDQVVSNASPVSNNAGALSAYLDPNSRLNRLVNCMGSIDAQNEEARHMSSGTHDKGGGRVLILTSHRKKKTEKENATQHSMEAEDLGKYNYTTPASVEYNDSDTDSEIGELTLAELLARDIEDLKYDMEDNMQFAKPADQRKMQQFLASPLAADPSSALLFESAGDKDEHALDQNKVAETAL